VRWTLPSYQEIEFYPLPQLIGTINEVEVTFVADPEGVEVILEFDKRGGFLSAGHDADGRFRTRRPSRSTGPRLVDQRVREASGRYQGLRSAGDFRPGGHHTHRHHGRGPGMGAMATGVAAGVVGGMILGETAEEIFEDDGDDVEEWPAHTGRQPFVPPSRRTGPLPRPGPRSLAAVHGASAFAGRRPTSESCPSSQTVAVAWLSSISRRRAALAGHSSAVIENTTVSRHVPSARGR
jgi:hypothetical protein